MHGHGEIRTCCTPGRVCGAADPGFTLLPAIGTSVRRRQVSLPGGPFLMGTDWPGAVQADGEGPVRAVALDPFEIDTCPVTNADFAAFVEATAYVTQAERFGTSFVFQNQVGDGPVIARLDHAPWWCLVAGACWAAPEGPGSGVEGRADHPVVHVSWHDAAAYAAWAGGTLPTEAQWEYAARGGRVQALFPWGDELMPGGRHMCNIWQGVFPDRNDAEDGFAATCPVTAFPANGFGLYSTVGNSWEWCADQWGTMFATEPSLNPQGPAFGVGRVMKGGSFLCHASYCNRYRVAARTQNTADSAASNIGFRCVRAA